MKHTGMEHTGMDSCPVCWSSVEDATQWTLLSRHRTSEGDVEYCLSGCGCVAVLHDGQLLKGVPTNAAAGPPPDARGKHARRAR